MRLSRVLLPAIVLSVGALAACREKPAEKAAAPAAGEMPGMPAQGEGQPGDGMKAGQEGASPPPGSVRLSADRQQFLGVVLTPVNKRSLAREVRTVGRVEYDERKLAFVNTKFAGWIERLDVDFTGVYVRKGQTLMSIYSPDLVSAQEEYLLAMKAVRSMPEGASSSRL